MTPKPFARKAKKNLGTTVLLIDISDKLTLSQVARLKNELENISAKSAKRKASYLKKGERLAVYFMEEEGKIHASRVFNYCNPGDVKDRGLSEKLSKGRIFAQLEWEKFTKDTLYSIESRISTSQDMDTSPILEAIKYVREKEFPPPDLIDPSVNYRILLWSDMIQNSQLSNHFKSTGEVRSVF